jgi:hypothetical protein
MSFAGRAQSILCALALLSGCASPRDTVPTTRPAPQQRPTGAQAVIDSYRREKGCHGPAYEAARRYAATWLDSVVSVPTEPKRVAGAIENGRFRIRLAQAAARKRCFDVARDTYVEVKDIFTGDPYATVRQSADRGLTALAPHPSSKSGTARQGAG